MEIIGYILTFIGGLGVALITQKGMDKRHQKEMDAKKDERFKELEDAQEEKFEEYKKEQEKGNRELVKQIMEIKDLISEMKASHQQQVAVSQYQIEELTREVREHNNFAKRMPVVEEQIKVANHRIADLEKRGNKNE